MEAKKVSLKESVGENQTVIVSTDIEVIQPVSTKEKEIHIEQRYEEWLEKNEYNHLAYSRY